MYCRLLASNVHFGYEGAYFRWGSACLKQLEIGLSNHFMIGHNAAGLREKRYEWKYNMAPTYKTEDVSSMSETQYENISWPDGPVICWTGWPSYNFTGHGPALKSTPVSPYDHYHWDNFILDLVVEISLKKCGLKKLLLLPRISK